MSGRVHDDICRLRYATACLGIGHRDPDTHEAAVARSPGGQSGESFQVGQVVADVPGCIEAFSLLGDYCSLVSSERRDKLDNLASALEA